jgi:DNA-binding MarR family transcriptional regulator
VRTRDSTSAARLRKQVQQFVRAFGLLADDQTPCGTPVNPREAHALMVVLERERHGDPTRQSELAVELGIDKSNVTRLVQRLRDQRRIEQVACEGDGRARLLRLTAKGRRLAETIELASRQRFDQLLARIPPADRMTVLAAMDLLNAAVAKQSTEVEIDAVA